MIDRASRVIHHYLLLSSLLWLLLLFIAWAQFLVGVGKLEINKVFFVCCIRVLFALFLGYIEVFLLEWLIIRLFVVELIKHIKACFFIFIAGKVILSYIALFQKFQSWMFSFCSICIFDLILFIWSAQRTRLLVGHFKRVVLAFTHPYSRTMQHMAVILNILIVIGGKFFVISFISVLFLVIWWLSLFFLGLADLNQFIFSISLVNLYYLTNLSRDENIHRLPGTARSMRLDPVVLAFSSIASLIPYKITSVISPIILSTFCSFCDITDTTCIRWTFWQLKRRFNITLNSLEQMINTIKLLLHTVVNFNNLTHTLLVLLHHLFNSGVLI